ncbi:MAG: hypothetical protein K2Z25_16425 [Beijerinckiaceae bacterium]|nr:hypothetical protein [Beijerinckiaceae bacterium]
MTAEIRAAVPELKGVYGFTDMPLKPHQLPGLVVDWGAESFEDVSNESPRMDGYVNRSIQADAF